MQERKEWVAGSFTLPHYITGEGDAPFRPEALLWTDADGSVLGTTMFRPGEAASEVGASFRETTRAPKVGRPRVPARVRVASPELAEILRKEIGPATEVVCAPTPELDEVRESFLAFMREKSDDGSEAPDDEALTYLTAGVTEEAVARLFRAAARLYRAQPWSATLPDEPLGVTIPELDVLDARLLVIGHMGTSFGLVLFPDGASLRRYLQLAEALESGPRDAAPAPPPHLVLSFERRAELAPKLAEEIKKHRWEIAGPSAIPSPWTIDDDGIPRPATANEIASLEAVAHTLADLIASTPDLKSRLERRELVEAKAQPVDTSRGRVRVSIASAGEERRFGDPLGLHADADEDADDDVLDGEAHEERVAELEEELVRRFAESPEGAAVGDDAPWALTLLEHARMYHGVSVADLTKDVIEEVVFEDIPRQVSCDADAAKGIVAASRAFFAYLGRELGLAEVARRGAEVLDEGAEEDLRYALSDESNFGMAKTMMMAGKKAGYDMTTKEGAEAWMRVLNERLASGEGFGAFGGMPPVSRLAGAQAADPAKKKKRKTQRASRRKNRR